MTWDREVELLVIGAGAGGLTAALVGALEGLDVLVCEKTDQAGGTTSTSGGTIWVPGNTQSRLTPTPDSVDEARIYLDGEAGNLGAATLREAFYASGAEALDYLEAHSEVTFKANSPYPDYHSERPGAALGGRALTPLPFDGRKLGRDFRRLRPPVPEFMALGGMMVPREEIGMMTRPWTSPRAFSTAARRVGGYLLDRLSGWPRGTRVILGNALIARLLFSAREAGVEVAYDTRLMSLVRGDDGVEGAVVESGGQRHTIRATRGVVLGTGGCAASPDWWHRLSPDAPLETSLAFSGNSGDGLEAATGIGAHMDTDHAEPFFYMPASIMRWRSGRTAVFPHIRDRPKPGLIAVDPTGRRFVNESASYHDVVVAMRRAGLTQAYLICDRRFIRTYGLGVIHPVWQWLPAFLRAGYLVEARSIPALAARLGMDANALEAAVAGHNTAAERGVDEAFGKGGTVYNRHNGDKAHAPNPCLGPIDRAPFFALRIMPAPIGSSAGLATSADGEVLDAEGTVIGGLYAVGNDMSSIMGGTYPGPGITLGPALVFGYRAARHAARGKVPPA